MPASRLRLLLCAAWACLAGCLPHDQTVSSTNARGGGSETTVVGRVLDDSGHAVAGASVWMRGEEDSPLDQGGIDSGSAGRALAYSDADGRYRIDGVHPGLRYLIECRRGIGQAAAVFAQAEDEDTVHAPDAILRPTGVVRGRVRFPDSSGIGLSTYAYIPGLWQKSVLNPDAPAFAIADVPDGTYSLRLQPAFPYGLADFGILELTGIKIIPGETTDVGELTLPLRAATTGSAAYARDSATVADFVFGDETAPDIEHFSAVLGNRIVKLFDVAGELREITDRIRDLDALESIFLINFYTRDSLLPDIITPKPLSPAISELPHLRSLRLMFMPASGYPRWTGTFPALTGLDVVGAGFATIPDWVLDRKRLAYLDLNSNGIEAVPETLSALRSLRVLSLEYNGLDAFPPILLRMSSLQGVNLRYNHICSTTPTEKAWILHQDSLWYQQLDPLEGQRDTTAWEATQHCGTP